MAISLLDKAQFAADLIAKGKYGAIIHLDGFFLGVGMERELGSILPYVPDQDLIHLLLGNSISVVRDTPEEIQKIVIKSFNSDYISHNIRMMDDVWPPPPAARFAVINMWPVMSHHISCVPRYEFKRLVIGPRSPDL